MFKVYASVDQAMSPAKIPGYAQRAEALGFDGLCVPDAVHEGLTCAGIALMATQKLKVATGVLVAFPRSPMVVAQAAWDLQAVSNGRFELGLGTQVKGNIVHRYSAKWEAPLAQMRDYIGALKAIFQAFKSGEELQFQGEHYQFSRLQPFFNPGPIDAPDVPIYLGAVGPAMTSLVGQIADGLLAHPTNTSPRYILEVIRPRLQKGAQKTGREVANIRLMLSSLVATGRNDEAVSNSLEKQKKLLAFLYSTPAYWPSLELYGWQETGKQLYNLTKSNSWDKMAALISDQMLAEFVAVGNYGEIAAVLRGRYQGVSDWITFPVPESPEDDPDCAAAIKDLKGR